MHEKLIEVPNITCYMGYVIWTQVYLASASIYLMTILYGVTSFSGIKF